MILIVRRTAYLGRWRQVPACRNRRIAHLKIAKKPLAREITHSLWYWNKI
jgi:hypothetical protein